MEGGRRSCKVLMSRTKPPSTRGFSRCPKPQISNWVPRNRYSHYAPPGPMRQLKRLWPSRSSWGFLEHPMVHHVSQNKQTPCLLLEAHSGEALVRKYKCGCKGAQVQHLNEGPLEAHIPERVLTIRGSIERTSSFLCYSPGVLPFLECQSWRSSILVLIPNGV